MRILKTLLLSLFLTTQAFAFGTDGCDSSTIFLCHFDGANNSTTTTESACSGTGSKPITFIGNAKIDTTQYVFGPSSIRFDGAGDAISTPSSADFNFGTGDFYISLRMRWNSKSGDDCIIGRGVSTPTFYFKYDNTAVSLKLFIAGSLIKNESFNPNLNQWYRITLTRVNDKLRIFVDGVELGTTTTNSSNISSSNTVFIGDDDISGSPFDGWMDEYIIKKGKACVDTQGNPTSPYCSGCEMMQVIN